MSVVKHTFSLPESIAKELSEFAQELNEKKSHIVAQALSRYFDTLDLELAKKRSAEVREGRVQTVSLEAIKEEMGIE